jgi:hypothetical protein
MKPTIFLGVLLLMAIVVGVATPQTHIFGALDTNNAWTGLNTYSNAITPATPGGANVGTSALPWIAVTVGASGVANQATSITSSATAVRTVTFPDASGIPILDVATQTMSGKTLTSPVINGTPTGTGIPTLTLKKGTGAANYVNATTSYTVADSTNLCLTVTIPSGWKLEINASGGIGTTTAAVQANVALTDNAACATANAGILIENSVTGTAAAVLEPWALNWIIVGDGLVHNVALQFKTSNAADAASLLNSSATSTSTMVFSLLPSN